MVSASQRSAAKRLGIKLPKPRVSWVHKPEGWPKFKFVRVKNRKGRDTGQSTAKPMRGKERCQHTEYIRNRAGRVLTDPDTGYLAEIHCKRIARWTKNDTSSGIFNMVTRYCDIHAAKLGAK